MDKKFIKGTTFTNSIGIEEESMNFKDIKGTTYINNTGAEPQGPLDMYETPFKCCKNCPNNRRNNPSSGGVCSCMLPYLEMTRW